MYAHAEKKKFQRCFFSLYCIFSRDFGKNGHNKWPLSAAKRNIFINLQAFLGIFIRGPLPFCPTKAASNTDTALGTVPCHTENSTYMKKTILFLTLLFTGTFALWAADTDVVKARLEGNTLKVSLTNTTTFVAFQMDIDLPEGVTTEAPVKGVRLSENDFVLAYNTINTTDNVVRVLAYNLSNSSISGESGEALFTMALSDKGNEPITLSNIIFADDTPTEVGLPDATATLAGDVNRDRTLTVNDLIALASIIIGGDTEGLDLDAADVNGNGTVEVNDLVALAQLLIN